MGAPRKHPPKDAATTIEDLAAQGHSIIGIAKKLGVSRQTFQRWCDDDESLQEAFEIGRETERQALHALIVQAAVMNKPANSNAMFLLKCKHFYREQDSNNTKVNVGVAVIPNVLVVRDHGTDEEWEARAAEQQKALTLDAASLNSATKAPELPASFTEEQSTPVYAPSWAPPQSQIPQAAPAYASITQLQYEPPAWKQNA
ncbi:MAG TPA: hypothetical protein VK578_03220 [Edaphobacter sp.]|nr:hypothetical protein [Edaphobacter sp.]